MSVKFPVLTYHSIDDSRSVISTSPEKFREQMHQLQERSFKVISLNEVVTRIKKGQSLPKKTVSITFDDGFKNFYHIAYPILKQYGYTATVFLVPAYCGQNNQWNGQPEGIPVLDLLDWDQIKSMADNGIDFGAHTQHHTDLSTVSLKHARDEVVSSKLAIQEHLGQNALFFAYPYGKVTNKIRLTVKNEFCGACSDRLGFVNQESDIYSLPRIDMYYLANNMLFRYIGTPTFPFYITFRGFFRSIRQHPFRHLA
jgi:peptidoglycan/xylan/chitin deacetylase (PgdA/CDA1 family)